MTRRELLALPLALVVGKRQDSGTNFQRYVKFRVKFIYSTGVRVLPPTTSTASATYLWSNGMRVWFTPVLESAEDVDARRLSTHWTDVVG